MGQFPTLLSPGLQREGPGGSLDLDDLQQQTKHFHLSTRTTTSRSQGAQVSKTRRDLAEKIMSPNEQYLQETELRGLSTALRYELY